MQAAHRLARGPRPPRGAPSSDGNVDLRHRHADGIRATRPASAPGRAV